MGWSYDTLRWSEKVARKRLFKVAEDLDREAGKSEETRDLQYKQMDVYNQYAGDGKYICVFEFCSQGAEPDAIYEAYAYDLQQQLDFVHGLGYEGFWLLAYSRDNMREKYYYDLSLPYSDEPIRYEEDVFDID